MTIEELKAIWDYTSILVDKKTFFCMELYKNIASYTIKKNF
ncbi:hypothetical protein [Patiriisocius marinus]|nr:hypothetical protein [Patiriisocius marinus]